MSAPENGAGREPTRPGAETELTARSYSTPATVQAATTPCTVAKQEVARPLQVLVPLIRTEIEASIEHYRRAKEASIEHYRRAGELLLEAKSQCEHGEWHTWVKKNFALSYRTAKSYMLLARRLAKEKGRALPFSMTSVVDPWRRREKSWCASVRQTAERAARADREATSQETIRGVVRSREQEAELTKQLTNHLINIGYRVLAVQLHPDKPGGSTKAMARLNKVKDMLKKAAGAVHEEIQ